MAADVEKLKVLQQVEAGQELDELVEWKIPYARMLHLLRELLADGLLAETAAGELFVTLEGLEALGQPVPPVLGVPPDPLAHAVQPALDPELVYVPEDELP